MPTVHPFSKIDILLKDARFKSGCLVDSNLLIAFTAMEPHPFYEDAEFIFEKFTDYEIPLFVTHTVKTEYIDHLRRRIITEALMGILSDRRFKLSKSVQMELKRHKTWISGQDEKNEITTLPDQRIKDTKQVFDPRNHSGQIGWVKLCEEFLGGLLLKNWDEISNDLSLNYAILRGEGSEIFLKKPLVWEDMYVISEKTALSSNDSMIMNVFRSSTMRLIASADYDLGYACAADIEQDRVCLMPDRLYTRHLKGLRFTN